VPSGPWAPCSSTSASGSTDRARRHRATDPRVAERPLDVTTPTLEAMRAEGHDVRGPVPGDTVFVRLRAGQYDAVVAMYHDQGHIPVKLLGFHVDPVSGTWDSLSGVNVTLGLPFVRTSPDHGTAFDIAGRGCADPASMEAAIRWARAALAGRARVSGGS